MASGSACQIIEFAVGVSPRGYQWSLMSPGTIYIESDLAQLMIRKAKMVRNSLMANASDNRGVLHYCAADVLDLDSMLEALNSIDTHMPCTIVTEGLLLYFTNDELRQFLGNIVTLLARGRNATWLTSKHVTIELLRGGRGTQCHIDRTWFLKHQAVPPLARST